MRRAGKRDRVRQRPWLIEGLEPRVLLSGTQDIATRAISVNFIVSTVPEGYLAATDVAGVVPVANWNNVGSGATNLKDDTGTPTTAEVGFPDITYTYSSADIVTNPDQAMMKSYRGDIGDQDFIFRNLPDSFVINGYDVYIYWGSHQTGVLKTPSFTIGTQTFYLRDTTDTWDGTHTLSTATTAAAAVDGDNYVLFTGLHLVDLTVQVKRGGGAQRIGISGIQFVSTGPAATVPVAPSNLSARPVNDTMMRLNWSDNSNSETGFTIERRIGAGAWQTIAALPANTSSYVDRSLTASTAYTYRVRATNAVGGSDWSNESSATTLPPGVTGAPRLFITQSRLDQMKAAIAVPGSTMQEAYLAMKARVDPADWRVYDDNSTDGNWNYARAYLAREASLMYLLTGDATYAQTAYTAVEQMYTNTDPDGRLPHSGYGLARATTGLGLAMTYDWALGGLSDAQAQFLSSKIDQALDAWLSFSHTNLGSPYTSNWNAVCRGGELILMLSANQEGGKRAQRFIDLKNWLKSHINNAYGPSGWTQEGTGYADYGGMFLVPAVQALRSIGDTTLDSAFDSKAFWRLAMSAYSFIQDDTGFERNHRPLMSGVDGGTPANNEGWTSLLLGTVPAGQLPYYLWFYDRFNGQASPAPAAIKYDAFRAGTTWALIYYPQDTTPLDPAGANLRTLADTIKGVFYFRNRWQDADDILVSSMGDFKNDGQGWNTAEAFQIGLIAFGTQFIGGPGKSDVDANFSTLLVDGINDTSSAVIGKADYYAADASGNGGGYLIVDGNTKYTARGLTSAKRHTLVDFDGHAAPLVLSTLDRIVDDTVHTYTWNLNVGDDDDNNGIVVTSGMESGRPYFLLTAPNGAWTKGWVLSHPDAEVVVPATSTGPLQVNVIADTTDLWVAMITGMGDVPVGTITGSGMGSVLTVNGGRISYDAAANRIISAALPPSPLNISGSVTSDTVRLVMDGPDLAVYLNNPSTLPNYKVNAASIGSILYSGNGGEDLVIVEGNLPVPATFTGPSLTVNIAAGSALRLGADQTWSALEIAPGSRLDLSTYQLIVDYAGPTPYSAIKAWIVSGYAGGSWTGPGITSSAASSGRGIGYIDDGNVVRLRLTWYGDANLDGTVNFADLLILSQNYNRASRDWLSGDFDYDGNSNFADLLALSQNYNRM